MATSYRRIWEEYNNQTIPKGYHIHHIDGNHSNNSPDNLMCMSPADHHAIHVSQGDMQMCSGKWVSGAAEAGRLGGSKNKGRVLSPEKQANITAGLVESYVRRGGSPLRGRRLSEDHIRKISKAVAGENNPMHGRTHTNESIQKMKDNLPDRNGENNGMFGKSHSKESRNKMSKSKVGKRWITDGVSDKFSLEDEIPEGWKIGRSVCKRK